jgi:hypothetical protein
VEIQDDAAKFDPAAFPEKDQQDLLGRKLRRLMQAERLPSVAFDFRPMASPVRRPAPAIRPSAQPKVYLWFDQLFTPAGPHEVFRWSEEALEPSSRDPVWSDRVTLWGDGRVDVRRAPQAVLEAMLDDLNVGLAADIVAARSASRNPDVVQQALAGLGQSVRAQASGRIAYGLNRYALTIHTSIGRDRRRWYVVATCSQARAAVHHRSPITW